jgi:hypothetical protein
VNLGRASWGRNGRGRPSCKIEPNQHGSSRVIECVAIDIVPIPSCYTLHDLLLPNSSARNQRSREHTLSMACFTRDAVIRPLRAMFSTSAALVAPEDRHAILTERKVGSVMGTPGSISLGDGGDLLYM